MPAHLLVALSSHGFGHLAQIAPVLNELRRRLPELQLSIQSSLPASALQRRLAGDFDHLAEATDFGMVMANAMDVLVAESLAVYQRFHHDWDLHLDRESRLLEQLAPDLLLADIPYLPLAAAARQGIPAVALCSLHWADILQGYCSASTELPALRRVMLDAYNSAAVFLRPAPSMPMPDLINTRAIGPVAALGRDRRGELNCRFKLRGDEILVAAVLGGVELRLVMETWPQAPDIRWLVPPDWPAERADILPWDQDMFLVDIVRSCDAVLTKPGYGMFTEAVCNGTPVLYAAREDWPETPWLVRWLEECGTALGISRMQLDNGDVMTPLRRLLAQPPKPPVAPTGIGEAVDCLQHYLMPVAKRASVLHRQR